MTAPENVVARWAHVQQSGDGSPSNNTGSRGLPDGGSAVPRQDIGWPLPA
jgi:hypothetical protein